MLFALDPPPTAQPQLRRRGVVECESAGGFHIFLFRIPMDFQMKRMEILHISIWPLHITCFVISGVNPSHFEQKNMQSCPCSAH